MSVRINFKISTIIWNSLAVTFSEGVLTCHSVKSTGVKTASGIIHAGLYSRTSLVLLVTHVFLLQWQVKISAVRMWYTEQTSSASDKWSLNTALMFAVISNPFSTNGPHTVPAFHNHLILQERQSHDWKPETILQLDHTSHDSRQRANWLIHEYYYRSTDFLWVGPRPSSNLTLSIYKVLWLHLAWLWCFCIFRICPQTDRHLANARNCFVVVYATIILWILLDHKCEPGT